MNASREEASHSRTLHTGQLESDHGFKSVTPGIIIFVALVPEMDLSIAQGSQHDNCFEDAALSIFASSKDEETF